MVTDQEHKSLLNRLERLEDEIIESRGEGVAGDLDAQTEGRMISAVWNGIEQLPIYSVMRLKTNTSPGANANKAAKLPELEYTLIDEDDKLQVVIQAVANPGDVVPCMIDGITLPVIKSRSDLTDLDDDPNDVIEAGDPLFIYNDEDDPQEALTERAKLAKKSEDDEDDLNQFLGNNPVAYALETQQPNAQRVRSLLRPRSVIQVAHVTDAVILDSRTPATKLYATQTYPLKVTDDKDIDAGDDFNVQAILKFDRSINRVRFVSVPLSNPSYINFVNSPPAGAAYQTGGVLYFNFLKVDLSSGTFKLEDLTWDLAHFSGEGTLRVDASISSLYSDTDRFVKLNSVAGFTGLNGFSAYQVNARSDISPFGHNLTTFQITGGEAFKESEGSRYFADSSGGPAKAHGDLGPYTGIHLYFNPIDAGGGSPPPTGAGDFARIEASLPDPKPGSGGTSDKRFPFAISDNLAITDT